MYNWLRKYEMFVDDIICKTGRYKNLNVIELFKICNLNLLKIE